MPFAVAKSATPSSNTVVESNLVNKSNTDLCIQTPRALKKIIIDPGHGGKDPGCKGKLFAEKDINLQVALKLGEVIRQNFPQVEVIYTRDIDIFVPLWQRSLMANKYGADIFISIHCNSHPKSKSVRGSEVYIMSENIGATSFTEQIENEVIKLEENYQNKYSFDPAEPLDPATRAILGEIFKADNMDQNTNLASLISNKLCVLPNLPCRGVKQGNFWVLYKTGIPSVLVEIGYLSNATEELYLGSEEGQNEIANAMFDALLLFY